MNFKLDHINLTVSKIDESLEWYGKVFGLELLEHGISPENRRWAIIGRNDSMICMTEHKDRESSANYDQDRHHQIYHFGFRIPDLEEWKEKVKIHNLKLYYGGVNEYPNSLSWYVKDPSGHTIEVSFTESDTLTFPPLQKGA